MNSRTPRRSFVPYVALLTCYVIFVVGVSWLWIAHEDEQLYTQTDHKLFEAASSIKFLLAPDFHDRAVSNSSISLEEELRNRTIFNEFSALNHFEYVYTLVRREGKYYFSAPTVTDEEAAARESWYFCPYEEIPDAFRMAYEHGTNATLSYTDEWGDFRSTCVYEVSPGGNPYLACADIASSDLARVHGRYALISGGLAVCFLLFLVPFAVVMSRDHRRHVRELDASYARTREHLVLIQNLVEKLPDGVMVLNAGQTVEFINSAFTEICGYTLEDATTPTEWMALAYEDGDIRRQVEEVWAASMSGKDMPDHEFPIRCKDGTFKHVVFRSRFLPDGRSLLVMTDITLRRHAQEILRVNLQLFQSLVENMPVGMMLGQADGTVSMVNTAFTRSTGYRLEDVCARNAWFRLAHPDLRYRKHILQTWARLRKGVRMSGSREFKVVCKDGSKKIFEFRSSTLPDGRSFVLLQDVNERYLTQETLRQNEAMLRRILNSLDIGIVVISRDDLRVIYANPKILAMTGLSMERLVGSYCKEHICANCSSDICPVRDQGMSVENTEQTLRTASGLEIPVFKSIIPTQMRGRDVFVEALVDITRIKEAEAALVKARDGAQAASKAKSEFLAVMSHELRTPLNGILGALQLINELEPEGMESLVENALQSSRALLTLIDDVLDLASMESGKLTLQERTFTRSELYQPVLDALQEAAAAKSLSLTAVIDPNLPNTMVGDPKRLRQVLFNLVGNAIKYTAEGGVTLEISILPRQKADGQMRLHFQITDTGIGIGDEVLENIFNPFTQADMALNRQAPGMGVGLAIVRRLVNLMGGSLCVLSEDGRGSEFHFALSLGNACSLGRVAG